MGLMYAFPVSKEETDHYLEKETSSSDGKSLKVVELRSYGLPYIFWLYLIAIESVIFVMYMAIREPARKLILSEDSINILMGRGIILFLGILALTVLSFYFYEKRILKIGSDIKVVNRLFGLTIFQRTFKNTNTQNEMYVRHFLSSPNLARIEKSDETRAFENHGYFELILKNNGKEIAIDRGQRKQDLEKIKQLLV